MFKLIILLSFLAAVLGETTPSYKNEESSPGPPTESEDASAPKFPYQVSLHRESKFTCSGAILNPTHVLTAANCVVDIGIYGKKIKYTIRAGSTKEKEGGVEIDVEDITIHPKYCLKNQDYDVAVLKLSTPLKYSDTIKPIKISKVKAPDGAMVIASGWGSLERNEEISEELKFASITMVNRKVCKKNYRDYLEMTTRMICAGSEGNDSCYGDKGGPLVYGDNLIGLSSSGLGCGRKEYPGIYTNLLDPEIRKFIKKNSKAKKPTPNEDKANQN